MNSSNRLSIVAAFDFDHTLIDRDSLFPLLIYAFGPLKTYLKLTTLIPYFLGFLLNITSRQQVKEKILTLFFRGMSIQNMKNIAQNYAKEKIDLFLKPQAMERLHWHQEQGHRCILISASLEIYLIPWAIEKAFDAVIASRLELTPEGSITGKLQGKNCWGAEKKRRLIEFLGPTDQYQLYAYGDSLGDQELLAMADYPFYQKFS